MADTLRYMWLSFMDELDAARRANGGAGDLTTERFGASVAMRIRDYQGQAARRIAILSLKLMAASRVSSSKAHSRLIRICRPQAQTALPGVLMAITTAFAPG